MKKGFDSKKYIKLEIKEIKKRLNLYNRIYLEFGGHLIYDGHASRILPGYNPKNKLKIIKKFKENIDIIYCISSKDINSKKRLGDFDLDYSNQALKDLSKLKKNKLPKPSICITMYDNEIKSNKFKEVLEKKGYKVFFHKNIPGYLDSVKNVLNGYDNQVYIPQSKKITIVTGAAGGSGKMATAMCQIYKERQRNIKSGFAKIESFPVWNLPIDHPINIAYEAATADINDKVEIDKYHLKKYNQTVINYNRDIDNFKILKKIAEKLFDKEIFPYNSPTEMGINMIKFAITNEEICKKASIKEIYRREKKYENDYNKGRASKETIIRIKEIKNKII